MHEQQEITEVSPKQPESIELRVNTWTPELQSLIEQDPGIISPERFGTARPCAHYSENLIGTLLIPALHDDLVRFHQERGIRFPRCFQMPLEIVENETLYFLDENGKYATINSNHIATRILVKKGFGLKTGLVLDGPLSGLIVIQRKSANQKNVWGIERVLNDTKTTNVTMKPRKPRAADIIKDFSSMQEYDRYREEVSEIVHEPFQGQLESAKWTSEIVVRLLRESGIQLPNFLQINRTETQSLKERMMIFEQRLRSANLSIDISEEKLEEFLLTHAKNLINASLFKNQQAYLTDRPISTSLIVGDKQNPWIIQLSVNKLGGVDIFYRKLKSP